MLRSGQGCLTGSVPSGGLCGDLQQWILAPACLGSPVCSRLRCCLPRGPELWGHPTPLSTHQRDPLTDPCHLWVEGPARLLEILSLKPSRICSSWCCVAKAGLSSALHPVHNGPFGSVFQVSLEQKFPPLCCSVASAASEFVGSSSLQIFYGLWVRS